MPPYSIRVWLGFWPEYGFCEKLFSDFSLSDFTLETGMGALAGGLLATYISAWGHVAMIYCIMLVFLWKVIMYALC